MTFASGLVLGFVVGLAVGFVASLVFGRWDKARFAADTPTPGLRGTTIHIKNRLPATPSPGDVFYDEPRR